MEIDHMNEKKTKKNTRVCPISHRDCRQCVLFRGKHLYLNVCKAAPGAPATNWKMVKSRKAAPVMRVKKISTEPLPNIILRVIDAETEAVVLHDLKEAEKWDWSDTTLTRVSEDKNVDNWEELVEIARSTSKSGYRELVVREIPRFMLHENSG
jgi:hypothetical protein